MLHRPLLVSLVVACVAGIPHGDVDSAQCGCATRAFPGYRNATCACIESPTSSLLDVLGIGNLVGITSHMKAPPTMGHKCQCEVLPVPGYNSADANCECESDYVPCPPHTSGHPFCWPDQGYRAIVNWDSNTQDWVLSDPDTMDVIDTPPKIEDEKGTGFPNYVCKSGMKGTYQWNNVTLKWNNNCTVVACPGNAEGAPNCQCKKGFKETTKLQFSFDHGNWTGACTKVNCAGPTKGITHPDCVCKDGYSGNSTFDFSAGAFTANCKLAVCPSHTVRTDDGEGCACDMGYAEANNDPLRFDSDAQAWLGRCDKKSCPVGAVGHPNCYCKPGYVGLTTWDGEDYDGSCNLVACPPGAGGDGCHCLKGHIPDHAEPQWDGESKQWTHTCTPISSCPAGCSSTDVSNCRCDQPGFVGNPPLSWTGASWGTCQTVRCPPHTISVEGGATKECKCDVGYTGSPVTWNQGLSTWMSDCSLAPCPAHAVCSTETKNGYCAKGYAGTVSWNADQLKWESTCNKVQCPAGSAAHPDCSCQRGYSGGDSHHNGALEWQRDESNGDMSRYHGVCYGPANQVQSVDWVCQGPPATLKCDPGLKMTINAAVWGRQRSDKCKFGSFNVAQQSTGRGSGFIPSDNLPAACSSDALTWVSAQCNNHESCLITPDTATFGNPCQSSGVSMYLEVDFTCQGTQRSLCDEFCTDVPCPDHSTKNADGSCTCDFGFAGTIAWERPTYTGQCVEAPCPPNATGLGPSCECPKGYLPSHDWGFSQGSWHGQCELQSCGPNTKNFPDCICTDNAWYENGATAITWEGGVGGKGFIGRCVSWPCPAGAAVAGECKCTKGFRTISATSGQDVPGPIWDNTNGQWLHGCQEEGCPAGSEGSLHPDCRCKQGFAGFPVWSYASSTWSGCTLVPCDADLNLVSGDEPGQCKCANGFTGSVIWDGANQRWTGGCSPADCPEEAECSGSTASCAKGFTGSVSWQQETPSHGEWKASCAPVLCPAHSDGHPDCTCRRGFAGGECTFADGQYSQCTNVACPANSEKLKNGNCLCHSGYEGTIVWLEDQGRYEGSCSVASCVEHAIGAPECYCDRGYHASVSYQFSRQLGKWIGQCDPVECPKHSTHVSVNCTCATGYSGTITWDTDKQEYDGKCLQAQCPPSAGGAGCSCFSGHIGVPIWSGSLWSHTCHPVDCPDGTEKEALAEGGYTCRCPVGEHGVPTWTGMEWDITCTAVSCPQHSAVGTNASVCVCDDGYRGAPKWNKQLMQYDGTCDILTCPDPAVGPGANIGCECPAGYAGSCSLSTDPYQWECSCNERGCPDNSARDADTKLCQCRKGYSGELTWNDALEDYDGACSKVQCPTDASNHPECSCPKGYVNTVSWDAINRRYDGACTKSECPTNAINFPDCTPDIGHQYVNDEPIRWDADYQQWVGSIEAIPCPDHADGEPNCQCKKGYAPDGFSLGPGGYSGSCVKIPCTDDHPGFPDCQCDVGYSGSFTWEHSGWAPNPCRVVDCPANAAGAPDACKCADGFAGTITWNPTTQLWDGECTLVHCPHNADSHPHCACMDGYVGVIEWSPASKHFLGSCAMASCPPKSKRVVTLPQGTPEDPVTTGNLTQSGVYRLKYVKGNFDAYVEVSGGDVWVKVMQWETMYDPTSQGFGLIATSHGGVGKLSDDEINFLADHERTYRFDWHESQRSLVAVSSVPHHDGEHFFGLGKEGTKMRLESTATTTLLQESATKYIDSVSVHSGSATPKSSPMGNIVDITRDNKVVFRGDAPWFVQFDLTTPQAVKGIEVSSADGPPSPSLIKISYANTLDAIANDLWTEAATVTASSTWGSQNALDDDTKSWTFSPVKARFWRVEVLATHNNQAPSLHFVRFIEEEVKYVKAMTVHESSTTESAYPITNLLFPTTRSHATFQGLGPWSVTIDFSASKPVIGLAMSAFVVDDITPKEITLEAAVDEAALASGQWVSVGTFVTESASDSDKEWSFPVQTARFWRVSFTATHGSGAAPSINYLRFVEQEASAVTTPKSTTPGIEWTNYTAGESLTGTDCLAVYMGTLGFDCNSAPNQNKRCFNGGNKCNQPDSSLMPMLTHVRVWVKLEKKILMHHAHDHSKLATSTDEEGDVYLSPIPSCECNVGCHGGYDWIRTGYSGDCQCSKCPAVGDCSELEANPSTNKTAFPCKKGYSGHVRYVNTEWLNNCVKVSCPGDSMFWPNCGCAAGKAGTVTYGFAWDDEEKEGTATYSGGVCVEQACPAASMIRTATDTEAGCACPIGFSGKATWNMTTQAWDGDHTCTPIPCGDARMVKSDDHTKCTCPVNTRGRSEWSPITMKYEGDVVCQAAPCPDGATCDGTPTKRKCATYYSGEYEWEFESQSWTQTCTLVGCPGTAKRRSNGDTADGCECFPGFSPPSLWDATTQSYSGCSQDVTCPPGALDTRDPTTNGKTCQCQPGYTGIAHWSTGTSEYKHSCTKVPCTTIAGAIPTSAGLCDCDIGYVGQLTWSNADQKYLSSCSAAVCPENDGVDCSKALSSTSMLHCKEGYHGAALWDAINQEWNNQCVLRSCPANSVPTTFPHCACKWGYTGTVTWDAQEADYVSTCSRVDCPASLPPVGDGHCRCHRGTEMGLIEFHANDTWTSSCSALRTCPADATRVGGDCFCNRGFSGTVETVTRFAVQDQSEVSLAEHKTEYSGTCTKVECPQFTVESPFPTCQCASGYKGSVTWLETFQEWSSTCVAAACPEHAAGAPHCACKKGYLTSAGGLAFDATQQEWTGSCTLAECPKDAVHGTKNGIATCRCKNGYAGVPKWEPGVGWTHSCTEAKCPDFSEKYVGVSDVEYQEISHSIGCHDAHGPLGVISALPLTFPLPTTRDECVNQGEQQCQAVLDAGGDCWGFAVSKNLGLKVYTSSASDYSLCSPDTGLKENVDWTSFRRKAAAGDCRCIAGYGGGFGWNGNSYVGGCYVDQCPENSDCGTSVSCHQGYAGSAQFTWDFEEQSWVGTCHKVECGLNDDPMSHPACECGTGYRGGAHSWDYATESWAGQCTKVDCVENSDQQHPHCKCKDGYARSDGVPNRIVAWSGTNWQQTCEPVPCPAGSRRESAGGCRCAAGYAGVVSFHSASGSFTVSHGDTSMTACARVQCPVNSIETLVQAPDGSATVVCSCKTGYVGDLTWNFDTFTFGSCGKVQCPEHSTGHPHCLCRAGYAGDITWTGSAYEGTCTEKSTTHTWEAANGLSPTIQCHRLSSSANTGGVATGPTTMDMTFEATNELNVVQCDVALAKEFTRVRGTLTIEVSSEAPAGNSYEVSLWNSPSVPAGKHYVAFGTPSFIADHGRESGTGDAQYDNSGPRDIAIGETAVPQTNTLRVELGQGGGVAASVNVAGLEVYTLPGDVTGCTTQQ